jgi:uncharacterized protein with HEPN domain
MLEHAREAVDLAQGKTRDGLERDRVLQLALTRLVEIVGEAAAQIPAEVRAKHPSFPWRAAVGMRNRLIHGYDVLDLDVLWDTITTDLPRLVDLLEDIVPG